MRIRNISLAGFRGIRSALDIPCGKGFTVICGPNGSGKSTVCDALEFLLTNTLERFSVETERREYIADYLWWRGRPAAEAKSVKIEFVNSDGEAFELERSQTSHSPDDSKQRLVDTSSAPLDWARQLCLTSIIRDDTITKFSTDQTERERSEFTLSSIGLAGSVTVEQRIAGVLKLLESLVAGKEAEYQEQRAHVERLATELSEARTSAAKASEEQIARLKSSYAQDFADARSDPRGLARTIAERISELRVRIDALTKLRAAKQNLEKQIQETLSESFKNKLDGLAAEIERGKIRLAGAQQLRQTLETSLQEQAVKSPKVSSLALLLEHGRQLGLEEGRCPLCGSAIDDEGFERHLSELKRRINESNSTLSQAVTRERESHKEITQFQQNVTKLEQEFERAKTVQSRLLADGAAFDQQAVKFGVEPTESALTRQIETASQEIADRANDLAILEAFNSIHRLAEVEELLNAAQKRAQEVEKELSKINRARLRAVEAREAVNRVSKEVIAERLAFLKPSLLEFCERLRPHPEWSNVDMLLRGDVRPFVSFLVGDSLNPRFVFSSGQRRALGLAFLFSVYLSRTWCHLETLILDDPVQHVDDYRALHLVETLSSLRMLGRQVICTTEDPALADLLCRRLRSTYDDDGVRIDLEYVPQQGVSVRSKRLITPLARETLAAD